jgi:hypothetical protein
MRFSCRVLKAGEIRGDKLVLCPLDDARLLRVSGKEVWAEMHQHPTVGLRTLDSNRWYWGVVLRAICLETGNDPESVHWGLKREAVRVGVLDPEYISIGDQLIEAEPTTVTDSETFSRYVAWVVDWARTKLDIHIEDVS